MVYVTIIIAESVLRLQFKHHHNADTVVDGIDTALSLTNTLLSQAFECTSKTVMC